MINIPRILRACITVMVHNLFLLCAYENICFLPFKPINITILKDIILFIEWVIHVIWTRSCFPLLFFLLFMH